MSAGAASPPAARAAAARMEPAARSNGWGARLALALALVAGPAPALAAELEGRVVGVKDGDTIELLAAGNQRTTVRLAAIDAPEIKQAYGQAAKRMLSALAFDRQARVVWSKHDDYGRVVGTLWVDGADAGLRMVERGYAWHYKRYEREQAPADRRRYAEAEARARAERRGLWADPDAVPPWLFRRGVRAAPPPRRTLRHIKSRAGPRG